MKNNIRYLFASMAILLLSGCGGDRPANMDAPMAVDSLQTVGEPVPEMAQSAGEIPVPVTPPRTSAQAPSKMPAEAGNGQMLVYASDSMVEHREYRVVALLNTVLDRASAVREIAGATGQSESQVAADAVLHAVKLSDSIRVTLVYNTDDFQLISENPVFNCRFTSGQTQYFDWEIEPQSPGEKVLTVRIESFVNGSWNACMAPQTIRIRVKVNSQTLITGAWDKLQNDPGWILDKVLLPVLAFVAGLFATWIKRKLFGTKTE